MVAALTLRPPCWSYKYREIDVILVDCTDFSREPIYFICKGEAKAEGKSLSAPRIEGKDSTGEKSRRKKAASLCHTHQTGS